jgi:replicative DNA helicase
MANNGDPTDEYTARAAQWEALRNVQANLAARVRAAGDAVPDDAGELAKQARDALEQALAMGAKGEGVAATLGQVAANYWETLASQKAAASTGLERLDDALGGGLQPGKLVALLGGPGVGKTTLANQVAEHIANSGRAVCYVSTEDSVFVLLCKTVARLAGLNYGNVQHPDQFSREKITQALADIAARRSATRLLYLDEFPGVGELQAVAGAHFATYAEAGPGLVVVDYLQRCARAGAGDRELRIAVGVLTDRLRALARALDCCVLALVSQNRQGYESDGDKVMSSAKESGDIEYSCDVLMSLIKDTTRTAPITCEARKLFIVKNRQGQADKPILLDWMGGRQQFTTVETRT